MRLFALVIMLTSFSAFAGVEAYSSPSMQKIFIEEASALGKDVYLVKVSGVEFDWKDQVIQTKRKVQKNYTSYSFDYKLELSNGSHDRTYTLLTTEGKTLVEGTLVQQMKLWNPGNAKEGILFTYDKKLTEASQTIGLVDEHKKKPYTPDVP